MLRIGEFSVLSQISIHMLRHYKMILRDIGITVKNSYRLLTR